MLCLLYCVVFIYCIVFIVLYCFVFMLYLLYCIVFIVLYCTALFIVLYVVVLYCIYCVMYFIVLYCPALHCSTLPPVINPLPINNNNNKLGMYLKISEYLRQLGIPLTVIFFYLRPANRPTITFGDPRYMKSRYCVTPGNTTFGLPGC